MNQITHLPGFPDPIHDSQKTFRALLDAHARPGTPYLITANLTIPQGLNSGCAAACLTLFDLDVQVWLQPSFEPQVKAWLLFHTGCRFTTQPEQADFAVIQNIDKFTELSNFNSGTPEKPETSTTLLIQLESFSAGRTVVLTAPGILKEQIISPQVPLHFWESWAKNHQSYPLGLDAFLFAKNSVIGLPRTTKSGNLE
ncbi:phosphonate C-P lyase system protein PhnH [Anabaena cylindrica FACHB-243]|uniref:Phosphonate C-P lyase system protein PhnH n=1 Tax=Anabaena cylindrica (strain ATCC 27899 / PCC 7122) TaxID=272123 RepID=K9ZII4_ANACC|nr:MULTISPECIES: phosphonate C-P lyase system protein PhnH [Anabaena]AFZ58574.1 phosphonate C-P lyase system protein PhnH [Anabaena cylindrica PCC 7122]MBD2416336.1 phosphonate C-P lyase system protein PhnH [Anabaena cylindrica FACHB-243]MBY5283894.1 phosphonate C-P lyase system protein PhnH [Anabaena sp. CCAP 1446/1C]MBY5311080.1 phosphonate C-P lyase system protein PhnH [Anabaena sp. CCAP 1446/1C]MCM2407283.1 phosphonate C-P lyase system protein PhnH [Anabaena sp. CCAP 1446/1C]